MSRYIDTLTLELADVDIARGGLSIVEGVSLKIEPGEVVQLFGSNGSGKTSLLQTISSITPPAGGSISWYVNNELQSERPADLVSFIGHHANLKPALSGEENLLFWTALYAKHSSRVSALIEHVGLSHIGDLPTRKYSAGQKRRLDLARCLLAQRPFWILDEPTSSLDAATRDLWESEITAHQAKGGSAVIGTHDRLHIDAREVELG